MQGVQVLAEAFVTDFFYNNTQRGWSITRIIDPTLDIRYSPMYTKKDRFDGL